MKRRQELEKKKPTEDKSCLLRYRECTCPGKEFKDIWTKILEHRESLPFTWPSQPAVGSTCQRIRWAHYVPCSYSSYMERSSEMDKDIRANREFSEMSMLAVRN